MAAIKIGDKVTTKSGQSFTVKGIAVVARVVSSPAEIASVNGKLVAEETSRGGQPETNEILWGD